MAAVRHLERCHWFRPDHPEGLLLAARVVRRSGGFDRAQGMLERYWRQRGDDDDLVLERLLLRATRGETEALRASFQERIDRDDPASSLLYEALLLGYVHRFRLRDAERLAEAWLKHQPDNPVAHWQVGKLHELAHRYTDAVDRYRRGLELDPALDEARIRLATVLVQLKNGREALPHAEYLSGRLGPHPDVELARARALDLLNRSSEAREVLDRLLRRQPGHAEALGECGRIALRAGDGVAAEDVLRRAVDLDPGNVLTRYQYYLALGANGKLEEANRQQEQIHILEGDLKKMDQIISERIPRAPANADLCYEVALIALRSGLPRETFRWLENALEVDPNHLPTHRALATYHQKMGNPVLSSRHRSIAQRLSQARPAAQEKR